MLVYQDAPGFYAQYHYVPKCHQGLKEVNDALNIFDFGSMEQLFDNISYITHIIEIASFISMRQARDPELYDTHLQT